MKPCVIMEFHLKVKPRPMFLESASTAPSGNPHGDINSVNVDVDSRQTQPPTPSGSALLLKR